MSLTKTELIIANYFLEHMQELGFVTASAIALALNVSDSSIIRFIRRLGYKDYGEFRMAMTEGIQQMLVATKQPSEKNRGAQKCYDKETLPVKLRERTIENIKSTFGKVDFSTVEEIAEVLNGSQKKVIVGFRGSAALASFMASKLLYMTANVMLCTRSDASALEMAIDLTEHDCLVIYSFPMYSELNTTLVAMAQERKAKIIVFTDKVTAPFARKADYVLTSSIVSLGLSNSYIAPLWLTELLLMTINSQLTEDKNIRAETLDQFLKLTQLY